MLEAQVHNGLLTFARQQGQPVWQHHLTLARLVARCLRLGRSALLQTGGGTEIYAWSYLSPTLLWKGAVLLVTPAPIQEQLIARFIPELCQGLGVEKEIFRGDRFPDSQFQGLCLTTPQCWLGDRLNGEGRFPLSIPTLIDPADDLEEWVREELTIHLHPQDWANLGEDGRELRVKLTKALFDRPPNPYHCYTLEGRERELLEKFFNAPNFENIASHWSNFRQNWSRSGQIIWATLNREQGTFMLSIAPGDIATILKPIWTQQPIVLMGGFLDWETTASTYRQQLGLGELTCLKFAPHPQTEAIRLYRPRLEGGNRLPLPNTPEFKNALLEQVQNLCRAPIIPSSEGESTPKRPVVLLLEDVPLKAQIGAALAAEFGSSVQVESLQRLGEGILVSSWRFWRLYQDQIPTPQLLIMATLPIPSIENPLVAGRVSYYKSQHRDWFRLYLLPTALRELQRAVLPLRESQGVVALLDSRVEQRSYGSNFLAALEPWAEINYID